MRRRWSFPLFVVFGIGFAVAAFGAAWLATQALSNQLNQVKFKSAIKAAVKKANVPTDEECRAFAEKIERAFASADRKQIDALFDWDAIIDEAMAGIEVSPQMRSDVVRGMKNRIHSKDGLASQFAEQMAKGGSLKLLRIREAHGQKVILLRMMPEGGGINYYEFVPARRNSNEVKAVDLFPYLSSEFVSRTLRQMLIPLIAELSRSGISKLFSAPEDRELVQDLPNITKFSIAVNQGKAKEALAIYGTLHESTRKLKSMLLARTQAAINVSDEEFIPAAEDFKLAFPDDPAVEFLNIDYYTAKKDYPKVLGSIDQIDRAIGGDPYLNVLRSSISFLDGKHEEAERFARLAIKEEPTLASAYDFLIQALVAERQHDETLTVLREYDQKFTANLGDLTDLELYAEFRKSPQYARWLDYLKERDGN